MPNRRVSVFVDAEVSPFVRGMATAGVAAKGFAHELESADSRMANLVQSGLALAPALVPIGAAAVPAIAGLTTQLGFAVAAAGTAALAFSGVGDALDALNKAQLEPTAANIEKAREAFDELGPAGQEFVVYLDDLLPKLQTLQDVAQAGLLPGVTEGIDSLLSRLPQVRDIISEIADTSGDLIAAAGDNLASNRWGAFFNYLETEARPVLRNFGETVGYVVEALANTWMAFDPLSDNFSQGLLNFSQGLAEATANLEDSQGFQEFLAYVRENAPQAVETLGAVGGAIVELVEAAAPVGEVVLPAIEALADVFTKIADSPIGPTLVTAAAAVGTLGRSLALLKTVGLRGGESVMGRIFAGESIRDSIPMLGGLTAATTKLRAAQDDMAQAAVRARDAQFALIPDQQKRAALAEYAEASQRVTDAEKERSGAIRRNLGSMGRAAGVVGGLALATSGLADKAGLANTTTLALMGTIAGPWGAAIGGGVGVVMDLVAANDDLEAAMKRVDAAAETTDLAARQNTLEQMREEIDKTTATLVGLSNAPKFGGALGSIYDWIMPDEEAASKQNEELREFLRTTQHVGEVYAELNNGDISMIGASLGDLQGVVEDITPALQEAGINVRDFLNAATGSELRERGVAAIRAYIDEMDSLPGRSRAVGDALQALEGDMLSNADAADVLAGALDSLFSPMLDQSEATDQWVQALRDMRRAIMHSKGDLTGFSKRALETREAIRGAVEATLDKAQADARASGSGRQLAGTLLRTRDQLIANAKAAGATKGEIHDLVRQMGLTPKNLITIIETPGVLTAKEQIKALGRLYDLTPKEVRTLIAQAGMDPSQAAIKELSRLYGLTPKEVRTIIEAVDNASGVVSHIQSIYSGLPPTITTSIVTNHIDKFQQMTGHATGGHITGPGTATSDSIPAYLSNGEYVIRAAAVEKYGTAMFDRLNAMHFATGGSVARFADGGLTNREARSISRDFNLSGDLGVRGVRQELRDFRRALREAGGEVGSNFDRLSDRVVDVTRRYKASAEALEDERQERRDLRADLRSYRSSVAGTVTSEVFGSGLASAFSTLEGDAKQAHVKERGLRRVARLGLDGAAFKALASSDDMAALAQLDTRGEVRRLERLYAQRAQETRSLKQFAGAEVFGPALRDNARVIAKLEARLDHRDRVIEKLEDRLEKIGPAVREGAREGIAGRDRREHAAARHRKQAP